MQKSEKETDKKEKILYLRNVAISNIDKKTVKIDTTGNEVVLIDNNEIIRNLISSNSWVVPADKYPKTKIDNKNIRMHQLIMKSYFGEEYVPKSGTHTVIDHLNNNHCDNRLRNLHILSTRNNINKKLLDLNFDNLSVYIEYDYDFNKILCSSQNAYTVEDVKKIYNDRKYILNYFSKDIVYIGNGQPFNGFELVYNDYKHFIKDIKKISIKTKLVKSISKSENIQKIKGIEDIKLNKEEKEKQKEAIINILEKNNWEKIRNIIYTGLTKEEYDKLSEEEKRFYECIDKTVFQYLPPDFNINE